MNVFSYNVCCDGILNERYMWYLDHSLTLSRPGPGLGPMFMCLLMCHSVTTPRLMIGLIHCATLWGSSNMVFCSKLIILRVVLPGWLGRGRDDDYLFWPMRTKCVDIIPPGYPSLQCGLLHFTGFLINFWFFWHQHNQIEQIMITGPSPIGLNIYAMNF